MPNDKTKKLGNQEINELRDKTVWASGKQKYRTRHIKISGNLEIRNQVSQVDQVQHLNKTDEFQLHLHKWIQYIQHKVKPASKDCLKVDDFINPTNFWSGDAAMFERRAFERIECAQKVEP